MSCRRIQTDEYVVVVKLPKSLRTGCYETWIACRQCLFCALCIFIILFLLFLVYGLMLVVAYCQESPGMALEALSIRNMTIFQNSTFASPESPWQVDSGFNVNLSTWNPNTVAGCFSTYRRMLVHVEYGGQRILQQEIPLGFGLKPRRSRPMSVELRGDHFQLKKAELGPVMEADLRSDNITLEFFFETRYLRNDRKAGWVTMRCHVVAKTPSNSSQFGTNSLLTQACEGT